MQVGKAGQLQEWLEDWDVEAPDQKHRHISHLYGLHPSAQITRRGTPDLFAAARKTLEMRGDLATGWSLAWKINFWARMEDGDRAYKLITDLITPDRTAPNLFDLHPPFQIDGNFGAVSGVCEMLLQSHSNELHLLPALPSAWTEGSVTGLRARGGATVSIFWKNDKQVQALIVPSRSGPIRIRFSNEETVMTRQGEAGKPINLLFVTENGKA
jgi:alpha-L-fucosidase 2